MFFHENIKNTKIFWLRGVDNDIGSSDFQLLDLWLSSIFFNTDDIFISWNDIILLKK